MKSKFNMKDGTPRPKLKIRGIAKLRRDNPSIPDPLAAYRFKKGVANNPGGRSKKIRISEALNQELGVVDKDTKLTRAEMLVSNLVSRAETDSIELERVVRFTEPDLLAESSGGAALAFKTADMTLVVGKLFGSKES